MPSKYELYQKDINIPPVTWGWNFYGVGLENFGRNGQPEKLIVKEPEPNQLLVRIDCVGLCFSDVKIIKQGSSHPKLYNRDLENNPTRLGHEVALTICKVGKDLQKYYQPGQRFAIQPDIYQGGQSTAYGYSIPGGLIQYHLIGPEILETDEGICLLPINKQFGYAESSLLEPWGCVLAAYTQRRRLEPKKGGTMWFVGRQGDARTYRFTRYLDFPERFVVTDVPESVLSMLKRTGKEIIEKNTLGLKDIPSMNLEITGGKGFDDIVVLSLLSAKRISEISKVIGRRGVMNIVGNYPLDGPVQIDVGRLHYDSIAFVGTKEDNIAFSYGISRNRSELSRHGTAIIIGAGGPMGQMHVQRALEMSEGPSKVIATEVNQERLDILRKRLSPIAVKQDIEFHLINPSEPGISFPEQLAKINNGISADDIIVCAPNLKLMEDSAKLLNKDGMLVLFAGVPNGTYASMDLNNIYLNNTQFTGTSGLNIQDQARVMDRAIEGKLSPEKVVAAVGGIEAAGDGMRAVMEGRYPGKVMIYPQIHGLPLMSLDELNDMYPLIGDKFAEGPTWTKDAEIALFEEFLIKDEKNYYKT